MSEQHKRIFVLNDPISPRLNGSLACEIGLNESIILLQIKFWISISNNIRDDKKWTYQSTRDMQKKAFPFWSQRTISRAVLSLEKKKLIITTTKYNQKKYDKTRWITLNFEELSKLKSISINTCDLYPYQSDTDKKELENQYDTPTLNQNNSRSGQNDSRSGQNDSCSGQNDSTIPDITAETTTEKTAETTADMQNVIILKNSDQTVRPPKNRRRPPPLFLKI